VPPSSGSQVGTHTRPSWRLAGIRELDASGTWASAGVATGGQRALRLAPRERKPRTLRDHTGAGARVSVRPFVRRRKGNALVKLFLLENHEPDRDDDASDPRRETQTRRIVSLPTASEPPRFRAYGVAQLDQIPQLELLSEEQRFAMRVVAQVLPF